MVQNMSAFTCPTCHSTHAIFGSEGVARTCKSLGTRLLCDVPLDASICADADRGRPTVVALPDSPQAVTFTSLAAQLAADLEL